jgi:hypothetical protein
MVGHKTRINEISRRKKARNSCDAMRRRELETIIEVRHDACDNVSSNNLMCWRVSVDPDGENYSNERIEFIVIQ